MNLNRWDVVFVPADEARSSSSSRSKPRSNAMRFLLDTNVISEAGQA